MDWIKDILPGREGHAGGTAPDNRLFVEAILYRFRNYSMARSAGALRLREERASAFRSLGEELGFEWIFQLFASDAGNEYMA
jgi:hypothetical protein